jgi:hypothetical protein
MVIGRAAAAVIVRIEVIGSVGCSCSRCCHSNAHAATLLTFLLLLLLLLLLHSA